MATDEMAGFGYKTGWLAVRDGNLLDLLRVLGGRALEAVAWRDGVDRAHQEPDIVLATPLLPGADGDAWLLVAGRWVASNHDKIDAAALSAALGSEVQRFVTHRVVDLHSWERGVGGRLVRSFEYVGESDQVTRWHGDPDQVELAIGLPATFDIEGGPGSHDFVVTEADVMRVAAAWSVDPTTLEGRPVTANPTVAQLPSAADRPEPQDQSVAVDVTDLIISGKSHRAINQKIARRVRRALRARR